MSAPRYYGPSPLRSYRQPPRVADRLYFGVFMALFVVAMLGLVGWVLWRVLTPLPL